MALSRTHQLFAILWSVMLYKMAAADPRPIVLDWSSRTYGPDGPWYAIKVSIGTPPQFVDLIFSHLRITWPLAPKYCGNEVCGAAAQAGYYIAKNSSTATPANNTVQKVLNGVEFKPGGAFFRSPATLKATMNPILDIVRVYSRGRPYEAPNCGVTPLDDANYTTPNSSYTYPAPIGGLSIGAPIDRLQYITTDYPSHDLISSLFYNGTIPSNSFAFSIGSPSLNITPQLVLGGYDLSRTIGEVYSQSVNDGIMYFSINVTDIGIATDSDQSAFEHGDQSGLFMNDNGVIPNGHDVAISFLTPYLALPSQTCAELAKHIPITLDTNLGVYLWKTEDPAYRKIFASRSYLYFDIVHLKDTLLVSSDPLLSPPMRIKIPFRLLNLTMDLPLGVTPRAYFPCSPVATTVLGGTDIQLGRAFLQAVTVGINWATVSGKPSHMFLTQAPGPGLRHARISPIHENQTTITPYPHSDFTFEQSWEEHWNAYGPPPPDPSTTPIPSGDGNSGGNSGGNPGPSTSSLSIGADVGIGVGAAVAVALLIALAVVCKVRARRRRKNPPAASFPSRSPGPSSTDVASPEASHTELEQIPPKIYELPAQHSQPEELESPISPLSPTAQISPLFSPLAPPSYTDLASGSPASNGSSAAELEVPRSVEKSGFLVC